MRIINKKKFIVRILEILIIIATIILTILSIKYATKIRGHQAFGGEYLVPVFGLIIILVAYLEKKLNEETEEKSNILTELETVNKENRKLKRGIINFVKGFGG